MTKCNYCQVINRHDYGVCSQCGAALPYSPRITPMARGSQGYAIHTSTLLNEIVYLRGYRLDVNAER